MNVKTKRIVTALLAACIVVAMMLSTITPAFAADDLDDLQQQANDLQQQADETAALQNATQEELDAAQSQVNEVMAEMELLTNEMNEVGSRIAELNKKISANEAKLKVKEGELKQAQEDLKVYYAALKGRIQMMYESDRSSYLEVLLNASSISEFFSKLEYISQMVEYDNKIMGELDACRATIQESKEAIEMTTAELEADRSDAEKEKDALVTVQAEKQEVLNGLESNKLALELLAQEQAAELSRIQAAAADNQNAIDAEQARIEEENRKKEEAENAGNNGGNNGDDGSYDDSSDDDYESGDGSYDDGGSNGSGDGNYGGGADSDRALPNGYYSTWPGIGNGMLGWPVDSYTLSSLYGPRIHPITGEYKNHGGIDYCADYGQPIYASASGTVVTANTDGWGGGWGNYVLIQHDNGVSTLYAHSSSLAVTEGERVSAGQVIAYVGSTGLSTGPHLHYEVYVGGSRVNPEDYL